MEQDSIASGRTIYKWAQRGKVPAGIHYSDSLKVAMPHRSSDPSGAMV